MNQKPTGIKFLFKFLLQVFQGALIGLGAVLPGISGGVLSVVFGVYKPIMELLSNPLRHFRTHVPKLFPYILGEIVGFMGVAGVLAFFLEKYPAPSVCLFVGLIAGMLPSLWKEAACVSEIPFDLMYASTAFYPFHQNVMFTLLLGLGAASVAITPGFVWYLFCGFCLALSIIAPGMSFSTLLMPLGLYTPFVDGIGHLSREVLVPAGMGALITIACLSRAVNALFDKYYSIAFHAIVGVVVAATVMIIPFGSFQSSTRSCMVNIFFLAAGVFTATAMEKWNAGVST